MEHSSKKLKCQIQDLRLNRQGKGVWPKVYDDHLFFCEGMIQWYKDQILFSNFSLFAIFRIIL